MKNCQSEHLISQPLLCRSITCQRANQQTALGQNKEPVGITASNKPADVILDCVIPLPSLIKPTMHEGHKIYNILKWVQHSQCSSACLRSFKFLFLPAEAAIPKSKHLWHPMPGNCKPLLLAFTNSLPSSMKPLLIPRILWWEDASHEGKGIFYISWVWKETCFQ